MADIKNRSHPTSLTPSPEPDDTSQASAHGGSTISSPGKNKQANEARSDKQASSRPVAHSTSQTSLPDGLRRLQMGMQALDVKAQASKMLKLKNRFRQPASEKRPTSPVYDIFEAQNRAMDAYDSMEREDAKRLPGLSQCLIKGALIIPNETELKWVRDTFDAHGASSSAYIVAEDGKKTLQVGTMDLGIFESFEAAGKLRDFVIGLSADTLFPVYLKHQTAEVQPSKTFKPLKSKQLDFRQANGELVKIPQAKTMNVRLVTALTLRALHEKNNHVAALLIGASPVLVMKDITDLPFRGNIFSDSALVSILRQLTPKTPHEAILSTTANQVDLALGLCIKHYLRHPPIENLRPAVGTIVKKLNSNFASEHLLLQNPKVFVREIALLLDKVIGMTSESINEDVSKSFTTDAGWQAATLVGNAFKYIQDTANVLSKSQKDIAAHIGTALRFAQSVTQLGASLSGPASGAESIVTDAEQSIADYLAEKALRSDPKLDLENLASDLAKLSDRLKSLARTGRLAPGMRKLSQETIKQFNDTSSTMRNAYNDAGKLFLKHYGEHLMDYSKRELERGILTAARDIR